MVNFVDDDVQPSDLFRMTAMMLLYIGHVVMPEFAMYFAKRYRTKACDEIGVGRERFKKLWCLWALKAEKRTRNEQQDAQDANTDANVSDAEVLSRAWIKSCKIIWSYSGNYE
jgi:hypothetical protein